MNRKKGVTSFAYLQSNEFIPKIQFIKCFRNCHASDAYSMYTQKCVYPRIYLINYLFLYINCTFIIMALPLVGVLFMSLFTWNEYYCKCKKFSIIKSAKTMKIIWNITNCQQLPWIVTVRYRNYDVFYGFTHRAVF